MDDHTLHLRPPLWLPIVVAIIVGGAYITGKYVEALTQPPATITVSGEGKVNAVPDTMLLNFGVETGRHKTPQSAMEMLSGTMHAIVASLEELEIEAKDITTQNLNLYPAYDYPEGERIDRGFEANQNLSVKVRDMDKLTAVLNAAVQEGANQVGGVSFTIDDPKSLQAEARNEAIEDAKMRATELAASLGKTLGTLRGYDEGGGFPPIMPMMRMEAIGMGGGEGDMAPPIPSGEQEIKVTVNLTYEVR